VLLATIKPWHDDSSGFSLVFPLWFRYTCVTMAQPHAKPFRNPGIPFDPLKYVKQLEAVGFTREQADVQAETFLSIVQEQLVSKYDLQELEAKMTIEFESIRREFESIRREIKELEVKMTIESESIRREIKELEAKTTQQIKELEAKTTQQIKELEVKTTQQIKELEAKMTIEFELVRRDIKELEIKSKNQSELMGRDLKIWFGGMAITLIAVLSGIQTLILRLTGH
jgi:hypothetical protein